MVSPRTFGRSDKSPWRAMPRRCPSQTATLFLGRTARVEVALRRARARSARHLPLSSCDPCGVGPSYPRFRRAGLSDHVSPPAWHELSVVKRQRGDVALPTPLLGRGSMVMRTSWSPQSCCRNAGSSRSFDREQDHVIVGTSRHELEAPEPNHRGARNWRDESGHVERNGKSVKNIQDPNLACQLLVFSPRGVTPTSEFVCVLPFPDGEARKDTKIYPGSGKRRPYVQRGEESLYYLAPKCLYRGEYRSV